MSLWPFVFQYFLWQIQTLKFEAGEIINVLFSGDTGWWEGEINGTRGWFPAAYVEKIQVRSSRGLYLGLVFL